MRIEKYGLGTEFRLSVSNETKRNEAKVCVVLKRKRSYGGKKGFLHKQKLETANNGGKSADCVFLGA